jgi:hypothetical protein
VMTCISIVVFNIFIDIFDEQEDEVCFYGSVWPTS